MFGKGLYKMVAVKQITITDGFLSLQQAQKKCQSFETPEDCFQNELFMLMKNNCNCIPYDLSNFTEVVCIILQNTQ